MSQYPDHDEGHNQGYCPCSSQGYARLFFSSSAGHSDNVVVAVIFRIGSFRSTLSIPIDEQDACYDGSLRDGIPAKTSKLFHNKSYAI